VTRIAFTVLVTVAVAACDPRDHSSADHTVDATNKLDTTVSSTADSAIDDATLPADSDVVEGTVTADGIVMPPTGDTAGWVVVNRFGQATLGADGRFTLPIAEDGATLTMAYAAARPEAPLLTLNVQVAGLDVGAPSLLIDVDTTARALVLTHPRVLPRAAWRLRALADQAAKLAPVAALASVIRASFDGAWTTAQPVRDAHRAAVIELLRRAAPPWDATLPVSADAEPLGTRVVRSEGRPIVDVVGRDGGLVFTAVPGSPPRFSVTLTPLDAGQTSLADVLARRAVPALSDPATTVASDVATPLAEGLYRVTIDADVAANTTLAEAPLAALLDPSIIADAVGPLLGAATVDSALTADPDHPLAALLDPRRGPISETFTLIVGEPFAARFDAIALVDGRVRVAGRHLGHLMFVDARGRARRAPFDTSESDGRYLTLPRGLVGAVHLRAETPTGLVDSAVITNLATTTTLPVPVAPTVVAGPSAIVRGASASFTVTDAGDLSVSAADVAVPVRIVADDTVVLDTQGLGAGTHTLTFTNSAGSTTTELVVDELTPSYPRAITFHADNPATRITQLQTALDLANGTRIASGAFELRDTNIIVPGGWYCPVDIQPDDAVVSPAPTCTHWSHVCDDVWVWDDTRSTSTWMTVTRPPGRTSSGPNCTPIAGPTSWSDVPRAALFDRITSTDIQALAGTFTGPNAELALHNVRGGGLVVTAPADGGRANVRIDLDITDAAGSATKPVLTLTGVTGVTITNLHLDGRPTTLANGCAVGLRIVDSHDVQIDRLVADNCDRAIEVIDSSDIRLGSAASPLVVTHAKDTAISITGSDDVFVQAQIGFVRPTATTYTSSGIDSIGAAVVVKDSERVTIAGAITATKTNGVAIDGGAHIRLGPLAIGYAPLPDGTRGFVQTRVDRGVFVSGNPDDVRMSDVIADQIVHDAMTLGGGTRTRLERVRLADYYGAQFGLRVANDGFANDLDVDDLYIGQTGFDAVRIESGGRTDIRQLVVDGAGVCGLMVSFGTGVAVHDAELAAPLCGYLADDVVVEDVTAPSVRIDESEGYRVERAETGHIEISKSIGVTFVDTTATDVTITGPTATFTDPISFVDTTLTQKAGVALSASDTHGPLVLVGVHADQVELTPLATVMLTAVRFGALTLHGGRAYVGDDDVIGTLGVDGGRLVSDDSGLAVDVSGHGELVARGALTLTSRTPELVALSDTTLGATTIDARTVIVSGATLAALDVRGAGQVRVERTTIAGALVLDGTSGALVADTSAHDVSLAGALDARLVRLATVAGISRSSTTRGQRTIGTLGLSALDGDPTGHGVVSGDLVHITAAPTHALVELLDGDGTIVARAFTSDGEVVFRGLPEMTGLLVQATLLDGTSGPPTPLATSGATACSASPAPADIREVLDRQPARCDGVAADAVVDASCRFVVRVATSPRSDLVLVDLQSGAETPLTDDELEERDPIFASDASAVWFARRALGGRWTLARVDLASGVVADVLALPGDALWPAPAPDGSALAFASCPDGEDGDCHLAMLDDTSGAVGIPSDGGWPAARACDERHPRWVPVGDDLGPALIVTRRSPGASATSEDVMSPLGLVRWRL